jgi:phosphoribosylglycinamide formyltransferase-1
MMSGRANRRLGILISGRGSNLQAVIDAITVGRLEAKISVVISNTADAMGLMLAREAGIETVTLNHKAFPSREEFDLAMVDELERRDVGLVCLAGFMRIVSDAFIGAFPNAILNIHPSLLPSFVGVDAQQQALDYGVKVSGATVHIVTPELDNGPIIRQAVVPVRDDDTAESLSARILVEEHRIYPEAIQAVLDGSWHIDGRRFLGPSFTDAKRNSRH